LQKAVVYNKHTYTRKHTQAHAHTYTLATGRLTHYVIVLGVLTFLKNGDVSGQAGTLHAHMHTLNEL